MLPASLTASRHLRRLLTPRIRTAAQTPGADRYRKHFPATAHLWLLLLHGLSGSPSLRQTYAVLDAVPQLFARLGLACGLSFSQLARSSTSRPATCFERVLVELVAHAHRTVVPDHQWRILRKIQAIDSTFLRLSAKLSPWSVHGDFTPGTRIQCAFDIGRQIPTSLHLTLTATDDHAALRAWDREPLRGWTVLIDLGYYSHQTFAALRAGGVSFLSRLHPQAHYVVTATRTVLGTATADGDVVLRDETITLGSRHNQMGAVLPGVRLITSRNPAGREQAVITDRFDLTAAELVRLYRYRWQIELFFRWLKHQLTLTHALGRSRDAVWLTVLVAAIVTLLLALVATEKPPAISHVAWLHVLAQTLQRLLHGG